MACLGNTSKKALRMKGDSPFEGARATNEYLTNKLSTH